MNEWVKSNNGLITASILVLLLILVFAKIFTTQEVTASDVAGEPAKIKTKFSVPFMEKKAE